MTLSPNRGNDPPERRWIRDNQADVEDQSTDFDASLVSLGFIGAAIRRSARLWGTMAVLGLLVGAGFYLASPHPDQASTSILLTNGPEPVPGTAILDQQTIAESRTVAGLALKKLGLQEDVSSFLGTYTATVVTDRILTITVNAPSSIAAMERARALAAAFLQYRADQLEAQQNLLFGALEQQVNQAKQHLAALNNQISQVSAQTASAAQRAKLTNLAGKRDQARTALTTLVESVNQSEAAAGELTASQVKGSEVLDTAAPIPPNSPKKHLVIYAAMGLFAGLVLGLGIVVIRTLLSDRLYRRDDIARALGAPVRLSVGRVHLSRWLPGRRGLAAAGSPNVRRITAYLGDTLAANSRGTAALAVVPVDDVQVAAVSMVSLATSCVQQMGVRVIVADLCNSYPAARRLGGTESNPAARLLGVTEAGVHTVKLDKVQLVVVVPDRDDVAPIGPLGSETSAPQFAGCGEKLALAYASADILLTLATPDPSVGSEHFATWAPAAVAMVTAGRSSWTRIHAVGEMIRLAGMHLVSAVLVGASKTDESLGVIRTPRSGHDAGATDESLRSDVGLGS